MKRAVACVLISTSVIASCSKLNALPICDQSEIQKAVEGIINDSPAFKAVEAKFVSLKTVTEQGYNEEQAIRSCTAVLVTSKGEDQIQYSIKWHDESKTNFYVEVRTMSWWEKKQSK